MAKQNEIKVNLTGVHLCCQGCVNAVDAALMSVEGVQSRCDMANQTVTLTASDRAAARKALDSLTAAGFYGNSNNQQLAMKAASQVPHGPNYLVPKRRTETSDWEQDNTELHMWSHFHLWRRRIPEEVVDSNCLILR